LAVFFVQAGMVRGCGPTRVGFFIGKRSASAVGRTLVLIIL
jgi:hypothetical protein